MKTDEEVNPSWQSKPTNVEGKSLEYKYIKHDEDGNIEWEDVSNRKVSLNSIDGTDFLIEDEGWNEKTRAKVVPQGYPKAPRFKSPYDLEYECWIKADDALKVDVAGDFNDWKL